MKARSRSAESSGLPRWVIPVASAVGSGVAVLLAVALLGDPPQQDPPPPPVDVSTSPEPTPQPPADKVRPPRSPRARDRGDDSPGVQREPAPKPLPPRPPGRSPGRDGGRHPPKKGKAHPPAGTADGEMV